MKTDTSFNTTKATLEQLADWYDRARWIVMCHWFGTPLRDPDTVAEMEKEICYHTNLFRREIRAELKIRADAAATRKTLIFKFSKRVTQTQGTPVEAFRSIRNFNSIR